MKTIAIIGGGASGIMAAIAAAKTGKDTEILLLEHKDKIGKKILSTGNGRCNLTNAYMDISCFRGESKDEIETVLSAFGYEDTLRLFEEMGLMTKSRNGYIYPRCDQAAAVLEILCMELRKYKVQIITEAHVTAVMRGKKGFRIEAGKEVYRADRVILSAGSKAAPVLGSDGSGYGLAKSLGHTMIPVVPALVQLRSEKHSLHKASGVRTEACVSALVDESCVCEDRGELQITAYGISGIPVFQISRYIAKALYNGQKAEVAIDFFPELDENAFFLLLKRQFNDRKEQEATSCLTGLFAHKLIPVLFSEAGIHMHAKAKEITDKQLKRLTQTCKYMKIQIKDTNGFENAQVCAGGVNLTEIDCHTMQSRYVDGLYLTGELLDVDGICGGYNLQWAWATGYIAGNHAAK